MSLLLNVFILSETNGHVFLSYYKQLHKYENNRM